MLGGTPPRWGAAASPLILDDMVVVEGGDAEAGVLLALGRDTGAVIWRAGLFAPAYSSPVLADLAGRRQILVFHAGVLAAHDPDTGAVLWEQPWPPVGNTEHTSQPVVLTGDRVFLSAGYGVGAKLYQVEAAAAGEIAARLIWESPRLKAKFTNVVLHGGLLYGLDDGVLVCLDPADGQRRWKGGRYGHGQILLAGDLLLVMAETGEVILVEASPVAHRELGRFQALEGKTWNHPALSGPYLLVRNDREAACYRLPGAD
jgi:outer membrane protein assembly factor BamB